MNTIKQGSFAELFATCFFVAAAAQIAFSLLGLLLAVLSPGLFHMNGVPATSAGPAIGTLIFLLVFGLVMNAGLSAIGSGIILAIRRFLPGTKVAQG